MFAAKTQYAKCMYKS